MSASAYGGCGPVPGGCVIPASYRVHAARAMPLAALLYCHAGHFAAALCALATDLGAAAHQGVIAAEPLAVLGAPHAHVTTHHAGLRVQWRGAQHEVRAGLTDFGAVQQQTDVLRRGLLTTALETVRDRLQAQVMAVLAFLDAVLHVGG